MKLTKSQLKKIIQEELAYVREAEEEIPPELLNQWTSAISEFISSQYCGGKGLPLRNLPEESGGRKIIIAALNVVIEELKTEPLSCAADEAGEI